MDSLVHINRNLFLNLKDEELFQNVFPKDLSRIRGKDPSYKKQVLSTLTQGQQALFAFMTIYYHNVLGWSSFVEAFSYEIAHGFLKTLQYSLEYLGDNELSEIIGRCEEIRNNSTDAKEKQTQFEELDSKYASIKDNSFVNAVNYIKNHTEEYVSFETSENANKHNLKIED